MTKYRIHYVVRGTFRSRIIRAKDQAHAEQIAASYGYRAHAKRIKSAFQEI